MILFIILCIIIFLFIKFIIIDKVHIDLASFFKKGFAKVDNAFGLYCYTGKQGKR